MLGACGPAAAAQQTAKTPAGKLPALPKGATGTDAYTETANVATSATRAAADAVDKVHEAGMEAFPAKTKGKGNQLLAPRMDGNVKVFDLVAKKIQWETAPNSGSHMYHSHHNSTKQVSLGLLGAFIIEPRDR